MAQSIEQLIPLIPLLPLLGAVVNGLFGHRLPRALVGFIANATVFAAFAISAIAAYELASLGEGQRLVADVYRWMQVGGLAVDVRFVVDRLSAVMTLVVTGVGFLIHLYSVGYMSHDPSYARYFAYLNLFTFAMLVLVLGDSLPLVFVGWEGVGLCSYLLIGFWYSDNEKANAGKKAFIVNRIGDFGFIVAMALLFRVAGTLGFDGLKAAVDGGTITTLVATAAALLLVLGATGKSAQLPLYVWLPDAMAGPTPVSALIHAATMVTAGVYLTARMGFLFTAAPMAMLVLAGIGAATALFAATIGTAQNDIKKVLAYSTVSQLGFMFIAAGVGAYAAAVFHLVTHAFFKACLFLGSGSVIHGMSGEQDMRQMGGLWKKMPITAWTFLLATLAITGIIPGLSGFISKDAILWNAFIADHGTHAYAIGRAALVLWGVGVLAAGFTSFYMWRLVFLTFFSGGLRAKEDVARDVHESPWTMTLPLVILALLSIVAGALSWPHALGGHDWFAGWVAPIVGHGPAPAGDHLALEWALMLVSVAVAAVGFTVAYVMYAKGIHPATRKVGSQLPWSWLHARVFAKWHIDELYDTIVIRPLAWTSRVVLHDLLDRTIIDGAVNLVGYLARTLGVFVQVLQTGNIQRYIAVFAVGLAVLLWGWLLPSSAPESTVAAVARRPAAVVEPTVARAPGDAEAPVAAPRAPANAEAR